MNDEMEIKIYHTMCSIAKICKKYFYDRKYLPRDTWNIENRVEEIIAKSKTLETQLNNSKKQV